MEACCRPPLLIQECTLCQSPTTGVSVVSFIWLKLMAYYLVLSICQQMQLPVSPVLSCNPLKVRVMVIGYVWL